MFDCEDIGTKGRDERFIVEKKFYVIRNSQFSHKHHRSSWSIEHRPV
jgi:hypothetical protein